MEVPALHNPRLTFRLGTPADVEPLLAVFAPQYFHECGFDNFAELDLTRAVGIMQGQIERGDTPFIVAETPSQPAGMASYSLEHVFTKRPIAVLHMIYVAPPFRRGPLGRMLLAMLMTMATDDDACAFFASIPPRLPSLNNMFLRGGFQPMGGAFFRRL